MPFRKTKAWGQSKPPVGFGLDWGDPINAQRNGLWLMNEGGGNIVSDAARKNAATLTNGATWAAGNFGPSVSMDGVDDYANLGTGIYNGQSSGTIVAWFNNSSAGSSNPIFAVGESDNDSTLSIWWFRVTNSVTFNRMEVLQREALNGVVGGTSITAGKWYHCAVTGNGSTWALYVNGAKETLTVDAGVNSGQWWSTLTQSPLLYQIGRIPRGSTSLGNFAGKLGLVSLWSRVLSAGEIARTYSEPFAGIIPPRRRIISQVAAAGGVFPWWVRQPSRIIGGGSGF